MGKYKKGKSKPHKKNPVGLPIIEDDNLDMDDDKPSTVQSIIEQLSSPSPDEKMCGLQALSHLCQNERNIQAIISSDIVRIAAPFLVDPDFNIRHAAAGAIRNLSAVSVDICENLVEQDVFTPLIILLNQYASNNWVPSNEKKTNQLDQKSDTFLQAVNIVWNLCESTSIALEYFNQSNLLENCLIRCLNYEVFGTEIAIAVGQCLLVVSEDNATSWKILTKYGMDLKNVLSIDQNVQAAMLVTSVAAIMANVPELRAQFLKDIIEALSKVLDINHRTLLNEITSKLPLNNEQQSNNVELIDEEMTDETEDDAAIRRLKEDLPSDLDVEKKTIGNLLSAQRIAVEVISNICTNDDEEIKSEMIDDDSDAESVHDYEVNGGEQQVSADKIPVEIVEAIKAHQIVSKIWLRAQPLPENVNQILIDVETNLSKRAKLLRVSSIICLQNLCSCMTTDELGGVQAIYDVWLNLGQQIFTAQLQETDVVESSTSLMRATLEHLKKSPEFFKSMNESDLQLILEGVEKCDAIETRANWLRMLGTLGCLLREDLVRKVVNFLLECTYKEDDVWTMSETLDSFMDMFSDNDWNQIVVDLNVVGKSKELEKILKTKIRQQKRELGDRYLAVQNVKTNFTRFCKYLEVQQSKFISS